MLRRIWRCPSVRHPFTIKFLAVVFLIGGCLFVLGQSCALGNLVKLPLIAYTQVVRIEMLKEISFRTY